MTGYKLSKRSLERLNNVDALLIAIAVESIKNSPYDFGIPRHGGFRTASEQNALFKRRPKVTNKDVTLKWGGDLLTFVDNPHFQI